MSENNSPMIDATDAEQKAIEEKPTVLSGHLVLPTSLREGVFTQHIRLFEELGNITRRMSALFVPFQINPVIYTAVGQASEMLNQAIGNSVRQIAETANAALITAIKSPVVNWLQSFDFSPIISVLEGLQLDDDIHERYEKLNKAFLRAMYDCKWFPYAGWIADIELFSEICDIIANSRGASKRREKRIDKTIIAYYSFKEIKNIKRSWKQTDLDPHIKRILGQAIDAHLRGEYALAISCMATMWEGLIYIKSHNATMGERHRRRMEETKQELAELTEANDYDNIFSDYFSDFIVSQCNEVGDVVDGVPNRHGVSHSWYRKYPTVKASLNAILLTDFIIKLKPKEDNNEVRSDDA